MLPTVASASAIASSNARVPSRTRSHAGLTSAQAWTLDHITHCPACGAWEVVTERVLRARREPSFVAPPWCRHSIGDPE